MCVEEIVVKASVFEGVCCCMCLQIKGTISTTFGLEAYHRGDLKADVEKTETGVNANGEIEWKNNQRLRATLLLSFPASRFHELNLTVSIYTHRHLYIYIQTFSLCLSLSDKSRSKLHGTIRTTFGC